MQSQHLADESPDDQADTPRSEDEPNRPVSTPATIAILASLYVEAEQRGLTAFCAATRWVLLSARERALWEDVALVPLKLLHGLYLAVGPRRPMRMVWKQRGLPSTLRLREDVAP